MCILVLRTHLTWYSVGTMGSLLRFGVTGVKHLLFLDNFMAGKRTPLPVLPFFVHLHQKIMVNCVNMVFDF